LYLGTEDIPITIDWPATAASPTTVIHYFRYTRNRAIDVYIVNDKVVEIRLRRQGYQPAENRDEVAEVAQRVMARYKLRR